MSALIELIRTYYGKFNAFYMLLFLPGCRPRPHRMFLAHMESEVCIRTFMCACQDALRAEQSSGVQEYESETSGSPTKRNGEKETQSGPSSTPSWVWKGNILTILYHHNIFS